MRARRAGRILIVSSVSGRVGWPGLGIYSASKFALEGLSETLALELAPLGIALTLIEPGGLRTDFALRSRHSSARQIADYAGSVGVNRALLAEHAGLEPGDPAKAAAAMLAITEAASPPLRLLLGSDALGYVAAHDRQQAAEAAVWAALSRSSDITPAASAAAPPPDHSR
jgi:NAD(P)-dependent dehydrogenase (short-subunit alcohol dehydrogenase family)